MFQEMQPIYKIVWAPSLNHYSIIFLRKDLRNLMYKDSFFFIKIYIWHWLFYQPIDYPHTIRISENFIIINHSWVILTLNNLINSLNAAGCPGHAGEVTIFPSTSASSAFKSL